MKLNFIHYKTSHLVAAVSAFVIHAGILVASVLPSDPIVINQQAIHVSFVAPSAQKNKSENTSHKEIAFNFERENSLKRKKEEAERLEKKSFAGKETSGRVDPNATATKSAESEPVFDAAYLNNPAPYYPQVAKEKNVQGKVLLAVVVKTDGLPLDVSISRSSGSKILDEAALDAVEQWRFIPARSKGAPVQAKVLVPVEFKII